MKTPFVAGYDTSFAVIYKPPNMHTVPLSADGGKNTLLHWCAGLFPGVLAAQGRKPVEGGAVHRLDYCTEGLVLFALTAKTFAFFSAEQKEGRFEKEYRAITWNKPVYPPAGFPPTDKAPMDEKAPFDIESGFRAYGPGAKTVRPVSVNAGQSVYRTRILNIEKGEGETFRWRVMLTRGFRHQIRCHLAWIGYPICGDPLYGGGKIDTEYDFFGLCAVSLRFNHPDTGKPVYVRL
jgi:23S rRNA pseudouridine1911/1915/1917 synthase